MITIDMLCRRLGGLQAGEVERWIGNDWLRAEGSPGHYCLQEIDVARVHLIAELRGGLGIDDETLPVVLSLLDQLYTARRQMRRLRRAVEESAPESVRQTILDTLAGP